MSILSAFMNRLPAVKLLKRIRDDIRVLKLLKIDEHMRELISGDPRYRDPLALAKYEYNIFTKGGEDGIIEEIFRRIGATNKYFVEFGAQDGTQNNTAYLLYKDWQGLWIEGDEASLRQARAKFSDIIACGRLSLKKQFVNRENIESVFKEMKVPDEFDFLSIDIDGSDYWVWEAIAGYRPRVVMIEYNAAFRPGIEWVMKYDTGRSWDGTVVFGASLQSLEILGNKKGYSLVGCDYTGSNAFFVRKENAEGKFLAPFTAMNHYRPPRYGLVGWRTFPG